METPYSDNNSFKESLESSDSNSIIHINLTSENVDIKNIEQENNLINYTNSQFLVNPNSSFYIKKRVQNNDKVEEYFTLIDASFQDNHIRSNSPVDSCNNSNKNWGSLFNNRSEYNESLNNGYSSEGSYDSGYFKITNKYRKLSQQDVEKFINRYYNNKPNKYSTELDILTTYIIGQKNLYIQSKYITQSKLNLLTIPTIFITTVVTILSPFIECQPWSPGVISALNAVILFLISLTSYLKLESAIEVYMQNAKQYDKLETTLEMANNKLLFIDKEKDKNMLVLRKIQYIEKIMNEIKESNNVLIPEEVKKFFPIICNINIFSFIKRIENNRRKLIINLTDIKNEIRFILYKWDNVNFSAGQIQNIEQMKEKNRLKFLYQLKGEVINELLELNNSYTYIDNIFSKEISYADTKKNRWWLYYFLKVKIKEHYKTNNPVIDKYFTSIFSD
jgi:hypothetical protein